MSLNRLIRLLLILTFVISACVRTQKQPAELQSRVVDVGDAQSILIQVDYGEVIISGSDDAQVIVDGQVLFTDKLEYAISSTDEQILVKVFAHRDSSSHVPLHVVVQVPNQMHLRVETNNASVFLQGFDGDLEITSIAGDMALEQVAGRMVIHSNRGNITVRESSGILSVVGNYGELTVQDVRGDTSMSTIMGNIMFTGLVAADDSVRLETDHGPVSVNLSADSSLALQANSTSGDVTCMLPDVTASTRTCDGVMHSGGGRLSIRTVSGAITLQLIP